MARNIFSRLIWPAVTAFAFCSIAFGAAAGGLYDEHAYADSFGNLVVYSPAGYKRIVVGKGHLANRYAQGGHPMPAHLEERGGKLYLRRVNPCHHGVLLHGRSYMYGLPDNVVPVLAADCR